MLFALHRCLSVLYRKHLYVKTLASSTYIRCCLLPRRFGLFTSLSARGMAREGEKRKIRREAPGRIRIQNGGSVFCKCSVLFILLLK